MYICKVKYNNMNEVAIAFTKSQIEALEETKKQSPEHWTEQLQLSLQKLKDSLPKE